MVGGNGAPTLGRVSVSPDADNLVRCCRRRKARVVLGVDGNEAITERGDGGGYLKTRARECRLERCRREIATKAQLDYLVQENLSSVEPIGVIQDPVHSR